MVSDDSLGSDHIRDDAQGMEVLKVSLLTQETADSVDHRFQAFEGR